MLKERWANYPWRTLRAKQADGWRKASMMHSRHAKILLTPRDRNPAPVSLSRKRVVLMHMFKKPIGTSGMAVSRWFNYIVSNVSHSSPWLPFFQCWFSPGGNKQRCPPGIFPTTLVTSAPPPHTHTHFIKALFTCNFSESPRYGSVGPV